MDKKTPKVKKTTSKNRTRQKKSRTKPTINPDVEETPRDLLIVHSKLLFPGNYKDANEWLLEQDIKLSKSRYYEIIQEQEDDAFTRLAKRGKNYLPIVADMGDKLEAFELMILKEVQKKRPNPIKINTYLSLIKIQPLRSAYDKQVKRLMDKLGANTNEHITV